MPKGSVARRIALLALAFPYIVDLALILAVKSVVGHAGYTSSPEEREHYESIVAMAAWAAWALSAVLPLPYFLELMRAKTRTHDGRAREFVWNGWLAIGYAWVVIVNGLLVALVHMVAWMVAGGG